MRSVIIAVSMLIVIIIVIILCMFYVNKSTDDISHMTDSLRMKIAEEDWTKANELYSNMHNEWHKEQGRLAMLFDHNELDNIQISFSRLEQYMQTNNKSMALSELSVIKMLIEHLPQKDSISFENLF